MTDWLVEVGARPPAARARVVALPWAGGGTSVFRRLASSLPADVAIDLVRMPGRESRMREPPLTDMAAVIDQLSPIVADRVQLPTMIFGYSLGALIAYELVARLSEIGTLPALLAVGGSNAPGVARAHPDLSALDDGAFVDALRELKGTPDEVFDHAELLALMLPVLRADFRLLDSYRPLEMPPLRVPIVTYSGDEDAELTPLGLEKWGELTTAKTTHRMFAGGHFFLAQQPDQFVEALSADLAAMLAGEPTGYGR